MALQTLRNRYVNDGAGVVPQPRLPMMLFDRLVLDVQRSEVAIGRGSIAEANDLLVHAQQIILELHSALDTTAWPAGAGLAQLYLWLHNELTAANVKKDAKKVRSCLGMVKQLQEAWQGAYDQTNGAAGAQ